MTDTLIIGKRIESSYLIDFEMASFFFPIKLDTGAKYTVVSAGVFDEELTVEKLERIKEYCEKHVRCKEKFVSASGDSFWGYLTMADNVMIGNTELHDFCFYLVVENKRDIALLGYDFIDSCKCIHEPNGNFIISKFDELGYKKNQRKAVGADELISLIESLSND